MIAQGLTIRKKSAALLQVVQLYSPKNTYDQLYLSNYATINILDPLSRIKGVGQATLFGPLDYSLRIWLDPRPADRTQPDAVRRRSTRSRRRTSRRRWAGSAPPPSRRDQQLQLTIKTQGRLTTPEEFGNIVLRTNPDGSVVRIKDVARVEIGANSSDRYSRFNGAPAASIGIYHSPGANAVQVTNAVQRGDGRRSPSASRTISPITCSSTRRFSSLRPSRR